MTPGVRWLQSGFCICRTARPPRTRRPVTRSALDTTVLDYAGFEEPIRWGSIRIERVYIEHEFNGLLHLQMGDVSLRLTASGTWTTAHPRSSASRSRSSSPTKLFPEQQQTGLQLYGSGFLDPFEIGYNLMTLSQRPRPGGLRGLQRRQGLRRALVREDRRDRLTHRGRVILPRRLLRSFGAVHFDPNRRAQRRRSSVHHALQNARRCRAAADVKWEYKSWLAQGEFIMNEAHFQSGRAAARDCRSRAAEASRADYRRWGAYGLLGYRLPVVPLMPYTIVQHSYSPDMPATPPATAYEVGVNLRATAAVVVKVEYTDWHFSAPGAVGYLPSHCESWLLQVAWPF